MIEFNIYKPERIDSLISFIVISVIVIIILTFLLPSIDYGIAIFLVLLIIIYLNYSERKKRPIGKIYLDNKRLIVFTQEDEKEFHIPQLDKLELTYCGYQGKKVFGDIIPMYNRFSGIDNSIHFEKNNREYKYQFFVEDKSHEKELLNLISLWENQGYDVSNIKINMPTNFNGI